jgi:hypothetical protein
MTSSESKAWAVLNTIITPTVPPSGPSTHPVVTEDHKGVVDKGETDTARDDCHGEGW